MTGGIYSASSEWEVVAASPRRSRWYVMWAQAALNRLQNAGLAVDGAAGTGTGRAIAAFQQSAGVAPANGRLTPATETALLSAGAVPPPAPRSEVPTFATPPVLSGRETTPPAATMYLDLPLGDEGPAKAMTGVFCPAGFRAVSPVDVILYLHGHHTSTQRGARAKPTRTIRDYWSSSINPEWPLREGLNSAAKNALLIAPTLGPTSKAGWLINPGGFDAYLTHVFQAMVAYGPYRGRSAPILGNLILACHSGGGYPMRQLAIGGDAAAAQVRECWGFDCLYFSGDERLWASWARSRPGDRLFINHLGSTATRSVNLRAMKVPNISVARSTARSHDLVPIEHWGTRLAGTTALTPI